MRAKVGHFVVVSALAFWLGGLTFYAGIVVPIANRLLGSDQQGLVTQQVTNYLNAIGVAALVLLFGNGMLVRSRALMLVAGILTLAQAALFVIHQQLDRLLEARSAGFDHSYFYAVHERYLIVVTIQWLTGLAALWYVLSTRKSSQ